VVRGRGEGDEQLGEGAVEEPGDDGEVAALIVGREEDRVFVLLGLLRHCGMLREIGLMVISKAALFKGKRINVKGVCGVGQCQALVDMECRS